MPRFACPRCQTIIEDMAGNIATCSGCGQRLQIPGAQGPPEATPVAPVLGQRAPAAQASAAEEPQFRQVLGRMHVFWACPVCRNPVDIPVDMRQQAVRCPQCSERIAVPPVPPHLQPSAPMAEPEARREEPYPLAEDSPPPYASRRARRERAWDPDDDRPRRRRRPRSDYDDDDDEDFIRRGGGADLHTCTRAANAGLTCSLISLGLMVVSFVIWAAVASSSPPPNRQGVLVFILFIAVAISFVLSLLGTISSSRGMNPINETNRGVATSGLVCGIIGLVISAIVGLFVLCIGLVVFSQLNRF